MLERTRNVFDDGSGVLVRGDEVRKNGARDTNVFRGWDKLGPEIVKRQERLQNEREYQDTLWDKVDQVVTARRARYDIGYRSAGDMDQPLGKEIYDGTTNAAIRRFVDGWQSRSANPIIDWFQPAFRAAQAKSMYAAERWLGDVKDAMAVEMANSIFYDQYNQALADGVSHGIATMVGPEWNHRKNRFSIMELHPREVFIACDYDGETNLWHRLHMLTARQIIDHFGEDAVPDSILRPMLKQPFRKHAVVQSIFRRTERDIHSPLRTDLPWASVWVLVEKKHVLDEGGYTDMEIPVTFRWFIDAEYPYPASPAIEALWDVAGVNSLFKAFLYGAQLAVRPPRLVSETLKGQVHFTPDGETYIKDASNVVKPVEFPNGFQVGMAAIGDIRNELSERFQSKLFQLQSEVMGKTTAYQANLAQAEATAALLPITTRANSQILVPMVNRFFYACARAGRIPPPPMELQQFANSPVDITMIGPMASAAKRFLSQQGLQSFIALMQELDKTMPAVAQSIQQTIDADEFRKVAVEGQGIPAKIFLSDEQIAVVRQQAMKMMESQQKQNALGNLADMYNKAKDAPEKGSPAQAMMGAGQ